MLEVCDSGPWDACNSRPVRPAMQDLAAVFDEINVSTSMHRVAKLSRKYEVSCCQPA